MHRFYLAPAQTQGANLILADGEAHHALHVLRLRANERVVVLNGAGQELLCEVQALAKDRVTLKVLQRHILPPLPYRVTLAQALTKSRTMDLIVQKATELGAHRIVPIISNRSVSQIEAGAAAAKIDKWQDTMVEAIKQCGSPWLPVIDAPQSVQHFLANSEKFDLSLIASLQPDAQHPRQHFQNYRAERQNCPRSLCVWIGPEGDFTPAEVNAVRQAGALPITLGPLVLRSETAAIYCLSILSYELQAGAQGR